MYLLVYRCSHYFKFKNHDDPTAMTISIIGCLSQSRIRSFGTFIFVMSLVCLMQIS